MSIHGFAFGERVGEGFEVVAKCINIECAGIWAFSLKYQTVSLTQATDLVKLFVNLGGLPG